jgi:hypothetical protein
MLILGRSINDNMNTRENLVRAAARAEVAEVARGFWCTVGVLPVLHKAAANAY